MIDYVMLVTAENRSFTFNVKELPEDHIFYCKDDTSKDDLKEALENAVKCFIIRDKQLNPPK